MALPTRRREAATSRPLAVCEPFWEPDELQRRTADPGVRRDDVTLELADAELGVLTVRVPNPEQGRPRRVEVQAREA
jgi:hypothetical protein